ncbi:MAG: glutaredoxin family protein [Spirochaetes bacterium]|nr:glutaredoxin family protein [Spirochaetota bacterium]
MKRTVIIYIAGSVFLAGYLLGDHRSAEAQQEQWVMKPGVAQYKGADWNNRVGRVNGITVERAKEIADQDPRITFFFITTGCRMVLEGKGVFRRGDTVFFSGRPWYGSAPGLADSYERVMGNDSQNNEKDAPADDDAKGAVNASILLYGRTNCGLCRAMMSRLEGEHIQYTFVDIQNDGGHNQEMWGKIRKVQPSASSIRLPVMEINGQVMISPSWERVKDAIGSR